MINKEELANGYTLRKGVVVPLKVIEEQYLGGDSVEQALKQDGYNIKLLGGKFGYPNIRYRRESVFIINGYFYRLTRRDHFNGQEQSITLKIMTHKQAINMYSNKIEPYKKIYVDYLDFASLNETIDNMAKLES